MTLPPASRAPARPNPAGRARRAVNGGGKEVLRAVSGMKLSDLSARDIGNGLVRVAGPVTGLELRDIDVERVYRVLENTAAGGEDGDASFTGLVMERVTARQVIRGLVRIRYDSHGGVIRDVSATGTVMTDNLPCGIAFSDTAHDFTLERCIMRGFRMQLPPQRYWNGDGFSTEKGNYGFRFLRCEAYDNTDGGFDLKSTGTFLDGCIAGGNKRNYRFWSTADAHVLTSLTPVHHGGIGDCAHIHVEGSTGATLHIAHLIVRSDTPQTLVSVENGPARIIIDSHDIVSPRGTPLFRGPAGAQLIWKTGAPKF